MLRMPSAVLKLQYAKVIPFGAFQRRTGRYRALQRNLRQLETEYNATKVEPRADDLVSEADRRLRREFWFSLFIAAHLEPGPTPIHRLIAVDLAAMHKQADSPKYWYGYSTYREGSYAPGDTVGDVVEGMLRSETELNPKTFNKYANKAIKLQVIEAGPRKHSAQKRIDPYAVKSLEALAVETAAQSDPISEWETRETYCEALQLVSQPERTALVLWVEDGLTYQEIAESMGVHRKTATRYVECALTQLKPHRRAFLAA